MIRRIIVKGLFGRFNYDIETKSEGVTIITGPNGYGKTTILNMIHALEKKDFTYFCNLDFDEFIVELEENKLLKICKTDGALKINDSVIFDNDTLDLYLQRLIRRYGSARLITSRRKKGLIYIDRESGIEYSTIEALNLILEENNMEIDDLEIDENFSGALELVRSNLVGDISYVTTQRLIRIETKSSRFESYNKFVNTIEELPNEIKSILTETIQEYSKLSNSLDGTYAKRLFQAKKKIDDESLFKEKLEEINNRLDNILKYKLINMEPIDENSGYKKALGTAFYIYFEDLAEKFDTFNELIKKLDLFTSIVNNRLSFKKICISPERGIYVVDIENENKEIPISNLSSGEKQEIILFYELIFKSDFKKLLMIDEPEISLHIVWQKKFLSDLLEITKYNPNLQIIVATHSPQIISNHWDLQVDLGEIYGE